LYDVDIHGMHNVDQHVETINTKVESDLKDEDKTREDHEWKDICFVRDSSVGILVELHCVEDDTTWIILMGQPIESFSVCRWFIFHKQPK